MAFQLLTELIAIFDTNPHDEPSSIFECEEMQKDCNHMRRLLTVMKLYGSDDKNIKDLCDINLIQILNDYLHLIYIHNDTETMEYIWNKLSPCDIDKCVIIRSNSLNKTNLHSAILNKIHCYYYHCFDIGNRLSTNDKAVIYENNQTLDNGDNDDSKICEYLIDKQIINMKRILVPRHKRHQRFRSAIRSKTVDAFSKYNQLYANESTDTMYSFGYRFIYKHSEKNNDEFTDNINVIYVSPKYENLKEELLCNVIRTITKDQFDLEYQKAEVHLDTNYCKSRFFFHDNCDNGRTWGITINNLLSLMIYCNFTDLQYEFSKTYRKNGGLNHNNFFFLGWNLKSTIKLFGTPISQGKIQSFFHGVGQHLRFQEYIGKLIKVKYKRIDEYQYRYGISIQCPLSTSSSVEVALNFTNLNEGLVINFHGAYPGNAQYFAVNWLSDYGNENEHLFVQNNKHETLFIHNIIDPKLGYQYGVIIRALYYLNDVISGDGANKFDICMPYKHDAICSLMIDILSIRLNNKWVSYWTDYARDICSVYFSNKNIITINYIGLKNTYPFISRFLLSQDCECIDLNAICLLFENVKHLYLKEIKLSSTICEYILKFLAQSKVKLEKISMFDYECNSWSILNVIELYRSQFQAIKWNLFEQVTSADSLFDEGSYGPGAYLCIHRI